MAYNTKSGKISVIMPCYNEADGITEHAREMQDYLKKLGKPYQLILVDDGSNDGTAAVLDKLASTFITVCHHDRNRGRGAAVRTGFAAATGDYVFTFDADLSYSPDHIPAMLELLESGRADVVLASAYHKKGSVENVPFFRALVSRMGNWVLTLGTPFSTVTCITRGYRREVLDSIEFFSEGKEIHLEILSKVSDMGYRIAEIPAYLRWRTDKLSKIASKNSGKKKNEKSNGARRSTFKLFSQAVSHLQYLFTDTPFALLGILASLFLLGGFAIGVFMIIDWMNHQLVPDRPLVTLMVILLLAGLQVLLFSMLANQNRALRREIVQTQSMIKKQKK